MNNRPTDSTVAGLPESAQAKPQTARLVWLDGLRGVAVLMILIHHFFPQPSPADLGTPLTYARKAFTLSYTGVDLFFVLSGFLIGGILMDNCGSPRLKTTFYLRRACRILPLAWLFILVVWGVWSAGLYPPDQLSTLSHPFPWWSYAGFVPNLFMAARLDWGFGPLANLWSLGVEEQFYLVVPWLLIFLKRPAVAAGLLIVCALASRTLLLLTHPDWAMATHFLPFCRSDTLGIGVLAACLMRSPQALSSLQKYRPLWWTGWFSCAAFMAFLTQHGARPGTLYLASAGYTAIALFYGLTLLLIATSNHSFARNLFSHALLTRLGRQSYFIYLFQGLVALGLTKLAEAIFTQPAPVIRYGMLATLIPTMLVLASMSWRWFEQPILRLSHRRTY